MGELLLEGFQGWAGSPGLGVGLGVGFAVSGCRWTGAAVTGGMGAGVTVTRGRGRRD